MVLNVTLTETGHLNMDCNGKEACKNISGTIISANNGNIGFFDSQSCQFESNNQWICSHITNNISSFSIEILLKKTNTTNSNNNITNENNCNDTEYNN